MKRNPNSQITFSQAVDGYLLAAHARHLSEHTLLDYKNTFRKFFKFLDEDPPITAISSHQVEQFLAAQTVSKKTVLNYHIGLSALWTWAVAEGLAAKHVIHQVKCSKPEKRAIKPYTETDVKAMLAALGQSRTYTRPWKGVTAHSLPNVERNRAIILLLLDTGMRAEELCSLRIHHADLMNRSVRVYGKGSKERVLPFSARTGQALWRYLAGRKDEPAGNPLFTTLEGGAMDRDRLLKALVSIGGRAGVTGVNVHRFRHTFSINFLRNGGDPWSLQMMLGHSTMEMVKTYLAIAQADLEKNHRLASPVDHWRL